MTSPDPTIVALKALREDLASLKQQQQHAQDAITGEVVHTSLISRIWAGGAALVVLLGLGISLGVYKRQIDDAIDVRLPAIEQSSREQDLRLRDLERYHRHGMRRDPPDEDEDQVASGAY